MGTSLAAVLLMTVADNIASGCLITGWLPTSILLALQASRHAVLGTSSNRDSTSWQILCSIVCVKSSMDLNS